MTDQELDHQLKQIQRMVDYYQRSDGKKYVVQLQEEEPTNGTNTSK